MDQLFWRTALAALWIGWLIYWIVNARKVKPARWRDPLASQLFYRIPLLFAAILLFFGQARSGLLSGHFLPQTPLTGALGVIMTTAGLALAIWARRCLGSNWSNIVTLKENHRLVRTGPYASIRHPIYSGLLLAIAGTAVAFGEWRDLLALGFALFALIYKARVEESRMREAFPDYEAYCRETAALIPFIY